MTTSINDVRNLFINLKQLLPESEVGGTIEIIGSSFFADEPAIFGEPNEDYILSELEWYLSQSLSVNDIKPKVPRIWQEIASDDGLVNSNYGYLMFSERNGYQYDHVMRQLQDQPDGRRAVAIYTRPSMHTDWARRGMRDFVCTNAVNYYKRNGALHAVVQMRSNDVIFGYRNDYAWQRYVLDLLAKDIDAAPGDIIWQAGSLHVYARHYHLIPTRTEDG